MVHSERFITQAERSEEPFWLPHQLTSLPIEGDERNR